MSADDPFKDYERFILPPEAAQPENPDKIIEMLVGQQISRVIYFQDAGMFGGAQLGLMLRSHMRPVFMAADGEHLAALKKAKAYPYRWGIAVTLFEALRIVTDRMDQAMRSDRRRMGEDPPDTLQERVEGELILGVVRETGPDHAEQLRLELSGHLDFTITATRGAGDLFAGLHLDVNENLNRSVFPMGPDALGPRRRN